MTRQPLTGQEAWSLRGQVGRGLGKQAGWAGAGGGGERVHLTNPHSAFCTQHQADLMDGTRFAPGQQERASPMYGPTRHSPSFWLDLGSWKYALSCS